MWRVEFGSFIGYLAAFRPAPTVIMVLFLISVLIGRLCENRLVWVKVVGLVMLMATLYGYYWYGGYRHYLANYFSCTHFYLEKDILVYHGDDLKRY